MPDCAREAGMRGSQSPRRGQNLTTSVVSASARYILGAGTYEATLLVLKLSGIAKIEGYAFIRTRIDWQGHVL